MSDVKMIYDFEISPTDFGLYFKYAQNLVGQSRKSYLQGETSYAVFLADGKEVKVLCFPVGGNFLSIPRVFAANDGYNSDLQAQGDGSLEYPLEKAELYSQTMRIDDDGIPTVSRDSYLFGNVDWKGKKTTPEDEASDAPVLTWKGPTGRSLPFDWSKSVEGYTTSDIKFSELSAEYYTCFSPNIYQQGEILATIPTRGDVAPKVTGCALTLYKDNLLLVCVVNNHYADKLGFFDEVWVQYGGEDDEATGLKDGWSIIRSQAAGRPDQCWFFNQSGNKCTQGNRELVLDLDAKTASQVIYDGGTGAYSAKRIGDTKIEINHTGNFSLYSDYDGDSRIQLEIAVSDTTSRSITGEYKTTVTDVPLYGVIPAGMEGPFTIEGPDYWTGNLGDYHTSGGYCACGTGTESVTPPTGCGMGTIVAVNACGQTATKAVRMPTGSWFHLQTEYAIYSGLSGGSPCTNGACCVSPITCCCIAAPCTENSSVDTTYTGSPTVITAVRGVSAQTTSSLGPYTCNDLPGLIGSRETRFWGCAGQYSCVAGPATTQVTTFGTYNILETTICTKLF